MNDGRRIRENNRDCVEADLIPIDARTRCIASSRADNAFLFLVVDGALGAAKLSGNTGFDLDEDQSAVVASDDVDFSVSSTWAVISGDDNEARAAQVAVRQIFTAPAEGCVR